MKFKRILVPFDFGPYCELALKTACELAKGLKSTILLAHVLEERSNADAVRRARERLWTVITPSQELALELQCEVLQGVPHRAIVQFARDQKADLIVMGTRARTGLAHVAKGSNAERVMRAAPCPVTIVRADSEVGLNETVDAIDALHSAFGTKLEGKRGETYGQLKAVIVQRCNKSEEEAIEALKELQTGDAIRWSPAQPGTEHSDEEIGAWDIEPDLFQEEDNPDITYSQFNFNDSPALDLLARTYLLRATDLHIDPYDDARYQVRLRIDGRMEFYCFLDQEIGKRLIQQFLTQAELDRADPFLPREGRVLLPDALNKIEARLTVSPVAGGDAAAIRIFSKEKVYLPLEHLGFSDQSLIAVRRMLQGSEGLLLITGPTGSGKTTAVYSMLETICGQIRNIVSIEDPVEFAVPFVRQISVDILHGLTMTHGLRTILRMDPDVVFLGEIRDAEAAEIAMRAASSGRFVFSTLHTRDVASTITAFRDLGIQDRSIAGNLVGIVNQRLVRRLCIRCRRKTPALTRHEDAYLAAGLPKPTEIYEAVGCDACRGCGYRGRTGVYETAVCEEAMCKAIASDATEAELRAVIRAQGAVSLTADALAKAERGIISFEEAISLRWL